MKSCVEERTALWPALFWRDWVKKVENDWNKWGMWMEEEWERKQMLRGERRRFTSCSAHAKEACRWSSNGGLLPWQYWEIREGKTRSPIDFVGRSSSKVPVSLMYLQLSVFLLGWGQSLNELCRGEHMKLWKLSFSAACTNTALAF